MEEMEDGGVFQAFFPSSNRVEEQEERQESVWRILIIFQILSYNNNVVV